MLPRVQWEAGQAAERGNSESRSSESRRAAGVARLIDGGLAKGAVEGVGRHLHRGDQAGCWSQAASPRREGRGRAELCGWETSVRGVGGGLWGAASPTFTPSSSQNAGRRPLNLDNTRLSPAPRFLLWAVRNLPGAHLAQCFIVQVGKLRPGVKPASPSLPFLLGPLPHPAHPDVRL